MKNFKYLFTLFIAFVHTISAFGQSTPEERKAHFWLDDEAAIEGYDPVSYFQNGPVEGKGNIQLVHKGITYYFSSEENKNLFGKSPEKYEPAYGGWCAYAIANGTKMDPDPETYLIQDGKVHLFYNGFFNNTKPKWEKEPDTIKKKADGEWNKMVSK
jgi:YHS domain-containing protein